MRAPPCNSVFPHLLRGGGSGILLTPPLLSSFSLSRALSIKRSTGPPREKGPQGRVSWGDITRARASAAAISTRNDRNWQSWWGFVSLCCVLCAALLVLLCSPAQVEPADGLRLLHTSQPARLHPCLPPPRLARRLCKLAAAPSHGCRARRAASTRVQQDSAGTTRSGGSSACSWRRAPPPSEVQLYGAVPK